MSVELLQNFNDNIIRCQINDQQSTINGYVCPTCGLWVPNGQTHICYGQIFYSSTLPCPACYQQLNQLIEKINQLIELIKKQNEEKKPQ